MQTRLGGAIYVPPFIMKKLSTLSTKKLFKMWIILNFQNIHNNQYILSFYVDSVKSTTFIAYLNFLVYNI